MFGKVALTERAAILAAACCALTASAVEVKVDLAKDVRPVKPMHAVGQPPLLGLRDYQLFRLLKEAGVPYARLHDLGIRARLVDIPHVFPNFDADETDPANYDFYLTDRLLEALVKNGVEPWFRLGVSIENHCKEKAYNIYPPKDYAKWARICEHVIRHYTEGWANGFKWKITYWEIWNEPDNRKDPVENQQWRGEFPQFCELYAVASRHLKAKFPHLKIGGYGRCTAHHITYQLRGEPVPEAEAYRERCFEEFCEMLKERKPPLDFFSFHGYISPDLVAPHTDYHRRMLRKAGYGDVELHLNEWLNREWLFAQNRAGYWSDASLSSVVAACLAACQLSKSLQMANIYDARCSLTAYAPLFDPLVQKPGKAYYALKYFNALYRLGRAVKCEVDGGQGADGLWVVAAKDAKRPRAAAFIVNDSPEPRQVALDFGGRKPASCRIVDSSRTDAEIAFPDTLQPHSFMLVEFA